MLRGDLRRMLLFHKCMGLYTMMCVLPRHRATRCTSDTLQMMPAFKDIFWAHVNFCFDEMSHQQNSKQFWTVIQGWVLIDASHFSILRPQQAALCYEQLPISAGHCVWLFSCVGSPSLVGPRMSPYHQPLAELLDSFAFTDAWVFVQHKLKTFLSSPTPCRDAAYCSSAQQVANIHGSAPFASG